MAKRCGDRAGANGQWQEPGNTQSSLDLEQKLVSVPIQPGVYLLKDATGQVIYVGKAASLQPRVRSYFQAGADLGARTQALVERVTDLDWVVTDSETEALILEFNLIQRHKPRYNVRLKDDKRYPYVKVTVKEDFPRIVVVRRVEPDGAKYFGPYTSTLSMWETVRQARRLFGVRQSYVGSPKKRGGCPWTDSSKWRERPCLDYYIKLCVAPCSQYVTPDEYRAQADKVVMFLQGEHERLVETLRALMEKEAGALRFEAAARFRDQIEAVERSMAEQKMVFPSAEDVDVLADRLEADLGCVGVIAVREGRMIGQDDYLLEGVSGLSQEHVLGEFLKQHYQQIAFVPRRILLPHEIEDRPAIEQLLTQQREGKVSIELPQRGTKHELLDLAQQNVELYVEQLRASEDAQKRLGEESVSDLQQVLSLPLPPNRIEAFDISNFQGDEAVGSMIVFESGVPRKSDYRRFKIRLAEGPDDFAMMRELVGRRLGAALTRRAKFVQLPDLMLVDGGQGQLNVAVAALHEHSLNLPVAALAKRHEEIYVPGRAEPIILPVHSKALHLLQRVRDEAHRFAVAYHRTLRLKQVRESVLDGLPGIGPVRKRKLLKHFRSVQAIRGANADEIAEVTGLGLEASQAVLHQLAERRERLDEEKHWQ